MLVPVAAGKDQNQDEQGVAHSIAH